MNQPRIAVLIPCYNESVAIGQVIQDFRRALPDAPIYVYDNNSTDNTIAVAQAAGALIRTETLQGKGHVIRRMFADIDADYYVLVDGDATYEAAAAPRLLALAQSQGLDMVNAARVTDQSSAYRRGHVTGNRALTGIVTHIFGRRLTDMLSGYRVFSKRFVKSFPALSSGFETETELTVHALELCMPIGELPTRYSERPPGSTSKLRTYRDGFRILKTILTLVKQERPILFFSTLGFSLSLLSVALGAPVIMTYLKTGLVPRLPTALLSTGLMTLSALSFTCGLILDSVTLARKEQKRMIYLSYAPPPHNIM
ncbi:glycosyltransferase family 2 protein [Neokomagataea anthophila]|uniref:Glycosyltransferase n=1 Tax=Neokomagataea anthophila TaxID=2826925 RepID=A0ABS5E3P3_9PROT|nr:glycosyltransferase family 2 protein [Neokomagataea anthophila]MBR0558486.1 glycosyltransferase [Neokomagataea anthophila]